VRHDVARFQLARLMLDGNPNLVPDAFTLLHRVCVIAHAQPTLLRWAFFKAITNRPDMGLTLAV
jgi:hypothetical protein